MSPQIPLLCELCDKNGGISEIRGALFLAQFHVLPGGRVLFLRLSLAGTAKAHATEGCRHQEEKGEERKEESYSSLLVCSAACSVVVRGLQRYSGGGTIDVVVDHHIHTPGLIIEC